MFNIFEFTKRLLKKREVKNLLNEANSVCLELSKDKLNHLEVCGYIYKSDIAVHELGLDDELVQQLVEDYVVQIIKAKLQFMTYLQKLQKSKQANLKLNYIPLRELAHKNLGVVKNLRIEDAQKILLELKSSDDLEYISLCLKLLEACAIKLKPTCAYNTIELIKVKSFL